MADDEVRWRCVGSTRTTFIINLRRRSPHSFETPFIEPPTPLNPSNIFSCFESTLLLLFVFGS